MRPVWKAVRVSERTLARLEAARVSMQLAEDAGQRTLKRDDRDRVSLDQVISIMLDARDAHARRRDRSRQKRREAVVIVRPSSAEDGQVKDECEVLFDVGPLVEAGLAALENSGY
jgi:hypothetical protein